MKKIGVIGVGKMGLSHLAIANKTEGLNVTAFCDTSKLLVKALSKNISINGYTDHKKMIKEENLDAVLISVPNSYHFSITKECLDSGLNVFIEKPLTLDHKESQFLSEMATTKGLIGQVGYVNRFNLIFSYLKELISSNLIGEIITYESRMIGGVILEEHNKGWRNDFKKGGGCLMDYGPHCIDLATFLFGEKVKVHSSTLRRIYSSQVDDLVFAMLSHENGPMGRIFVNWSDPTVRKATNQIEISGSQGKIVANKQEIKLYLNESNDQFNFQKGWNEIYITDLNTDVGFYLRGEDFSRQLQYFSDLLQGKLNVPVSSLQSAAITDRIISEIYKNAGELK